jgi:L-lysine exporter family protein LysE/ArgO
MIQIFIEGLLLQASLIFALGPQNLFVLESGLKRHFHLTVSLVCFLCDLSLIMLGVSGASIFFSLFPALKIIIGVIGVGFLIVYGINKLTLRDHFHLEFEKNGKLSCYRAAIVSALVFSVVNPHAYLDGIVLIGGYSTKYADLSERVTLGLGAATFSLLWFLALSIGASVMVPIFQEKSRMKFLMMTSGMILLFLSVKLGFDVFSWVHELYPEGLGLSASK